MNGQRQTVCGEWSELLSAELDGALTHDERTKADEHEAACRHCRTRAESLRALKHAVARLSSREAPPGAVRAHVEALTLRASRARRFGPSMRWILASGLLVVAAMSYVALREGPGGPGAQLAQDLVADHLHSVPEAMPAEVTTDDPAEAVRFFSDRVPFEPVAPRLEGAGLIGGRLCKIHGRRVQLLFYRDRGGETVSLFVSDQDLGGAGCRESRGLHVCGRRAGNLALLAVGRAPAEELSRLLDSTHIDHR